MSTKNYTSVSATREKSIKSLTMNFTIFFTLGKIRLGKTTQLSSQPLSHSSALSLTISALICNSVTLLHVLLWYYSSIQKLELINLEIANKFVIKEMKNCNVFIFLTQIIGNKTSIR